MSLLSEFVERLPINKGDIVLFTSDLIKLDKPGVHTITLDKHVAIAAAPISKPFGNNTNINNIKYNIKYSIKKWI